ncbi:MAG: long-chain fatty acid--CoA ligase [Acidimicrobiales bacterium]|nr:long-chain fatty acid--CoA ligase [Acidimicrobiales bacterium]HRW36416.1 AMP-dependent synthetase/ligase [Aquihabitans sp.]
MTSSTDRSTGKTVAQIFVDTAQAHPDVVALRWRDGDGWGRWTFAEYADRVARATTALRERGVGRGDRIVLMLRNCPEFHVLDLAALMVGATPVSIYNSSAPDQVEYLVNHSGAVLGIVEDEGFLSRFSPVRDQLTALKTLGIVHPGAAEADFTWDDLMAAEPADLAEAASQGDDSDLVTIIYTSGTTGPPKGVMISNRNVTFLADAVRDLIPLDSLTGARIVSYLPMAHIAERSVSHYLQLLEGCEVTTCPNPSDIAAYLREVKPHLVFGVPRVWEKIHAGVQGALSADPEKAGQFAEAVEAAKPIVLNKAWGRASDEELATLSFLDDVAFRGVRELLGLDECLVAITGAAPIPPDLLSWFQAVGVPLSEVYGMSENAGAMTWEPVKIKPGTVGPAVPGTEVALAEDGEVICRGPHVFQGYLNDPEKTAETIDEHGWLHTGDIGEIDDDGYLRIVDRKKELIITAGGKNISPANLEAALKMIPLVGQAAAIGDQRPFVSALVVLDPDVAPVWAAQHGLEGLSMAELAEHPDVIAEIEGGLDEVMAPFNNAERVKKVKVIGEEWLPDSDMLTPTSKLKRRGVNARYAGEIEAIYT